jgi:hypothetical protein
VPGLELGLLAGRVDGGINLKGEYMSALVGKFFHTFEDDKIQCQGQILSAESDDYFLIQYFSWIDGGTINQELIPFSEMTGWKFYETNEDMIERERRHRR